MQHNPITPTIEEVINRITQCQTKDEVYDYVKGVPPEVRRKLTSIPFEDCPFLREPDEASKEYGSPGGENEVRIRFSDKTEETTVEDGKDAYRELFGIFVDGLVEAAEQGKVTHFHIGEFHLDRESCFFDVAAVDIATLLGIKDMGIENEDEDVVTPWGAIRPGLRNYGSCTEANGRIPETHPNSFVPWMPWVPNREVFITYLYKLEPEHGLNIFATDVYSFFSQKGAKALLDDREHYMLKRIREEAPDKPVVHFCGNGHFLGLKQFTLQYMKKVHFVGVRTEQTAYLLPPSAEDLTKEEDPLRDARIAATHHPRLEGVVTTIEHARTLAAEAHKALGAELLQEWGVKISERLGAERAEAFFRQYPALAPKEKLNSAVFGGRRAVAQQRVAGYSGGG